MDRWGQADFVISAPNRPAEAWTFQSRFDKSTAQAEEMKKGALRVL
jgi:hypothetical protein